MNHKVAVVAAAVAAGTIRVISVFEGSEEKRSAVGSRGHGLLKQIYTKKKKKLLRHCGISGLAEVGVGRGSASLALGQQVKRSCSFYSKNKDFPLVSWILFRKRRLWNLSSLTQFLLGLGK